MKTLIKNLKKITHYLMICIAITLFMSCEDYLEVDNPFGQISGELVFENENTANAAITTMYAKLRDEVLLTGNIEGLSLLMGLYADELDYYGPPGHPMENFYNHQVIASDPLVSSLWNRGYNLVYLTNAAIEGLDKSATIPAEVKNSLKGEALFIRAFTHFHLVNLYDGIPYIKSTDFEANSLVVRLPETEVIENILADLLEAKVLLVNGEDQERTRANSWVVTALQARVYLYSEQWDKAEEKSSQLIDQTGFFQLAQDPADVFLRESPETIWQFKPKNEGDNTLEAGTFVVVAPPPQIAALTNSFIESVEPGDLRRENWIGELSDGTNTWHFPFKYKQTQNTGMSLEYAIVFRLGEQYLIRAEARARKGNITGAQQDLNTIRQRAGLEDTSASSVEEMIDAITAERKIELFTEHGHRWFDLKRLGLANETLAPLKPAWQPTDIVLPIPEGELLMNPNLNPQNPGY